MSGDVLTTTERECPFCDPTGLSGVVAEQGAVFAVEDRYPVSPGHTLVIPRRHTPDYFSMTAGERHDAEELLFRLRERLLAADHTIEGFNVGMNCGEVAGQTVPHAHIHLIPRRRGDTPHPRGGVRGVIPDRMSY